jgi:hypothetical protein
MLTLLVLVACKPDVVTFTQVQDDIFTNSCAFSSCHSDGGGAQGLSLAEGSAYAAIVGVPSTLSMTMNLIEPGDHENSFLWQKCANAEGIVGEPMPQSSGLDADRLAALEAWIDNGALND